MHVAQCLTGKSKVVDLGEGPRGSLPPPLILFCEYSALIYHYRYHHCCCYSVVPENVHTPPRRELEIPEGRGVKDPGNSRGEGGCMIELVSRGISCRSSCSNILSYLPRKNFHIKKWLECLYLTRIIFVYFLS